MPLFSEKIFDKHLKHTIMKTKNRIFYEAPTMAVVEVKQEGILCASNGDASMQNYGWHNVTEE